MSVSIHTQIQYRDKLRTRLGCIWFLVYEPTRPVGCSPRLIGCLDAPLIQAPLVQNLAVSLHPQKHHSPPFLHVQALASARGLHGCAWELHGCTRELEKVDTRMQAGERGNPRVTAPPFAPSARVYITGAPHLPLSSSRSVLSPSSQTFYSLEVASDALIFFSPSSCRSMEV
jgi:hypothetical protein